MTDKLLLETKAKICTHFENELSQFEIAKRFSISQSTVSKIIRRYLERKFYYLKHSSGRKKILNSVDLDFFIEGG